MSIKPLNSGDKTGQTILDRRIAVILLYIVCVFGGSSRHDVLIQIIPPIAAIIVIALALARPANPLTKLGPVLILLLGLAFTMALQLVPLPATIWENLPGRDVFLPSARLLDDGDIWRPISFNPDRTTAAIFACLPPIAMAVLWQRLDRNSRKHLFQQIAILASISAILGILQLATGDDSPFRFYARTNIESAVGIFANRNHNALLLAMALPVVFLWHSENSNGRKGEVKGATTIASLGTLLCFSVLIVAGSRAGLVIAVLGLLAAVLVLSARAGGEARPLPPNRHSGRLVRFRVVELAKSYSMVIAAAVSLILTMIAIRATSVERLETKDLGADLRSQIASPIFELVGRYFPFGTGFGTFDSAFRISEPDWILRLQYVNHAHNDWLEVLLEGGILSVVLAVVFATYVARQAFRLWSVRATHRREVCAGILVAMAAAASVVDYPLRTPAHAIIFTVALLMFLESSRSDERSHHKDHR